MSFKSLNFFQFKKSNESKKWSFVAKLSFLFVLIFLTGCGLKINEASPPVPVYYFKGRVPEDFCFNLDYEEEIKKYFFNLNKGNGDELPKILKCFSSQVDNIIYHIHNDSLTREEIHAVLDGDFIDLQNRKDLQNVKDFLKKILSSDYHKEFSFFKSYTFQLIGLNSDFNVEALCKVKTNETESISNPNDDKSSLPSKKSLEFIEKEVLVSKDDIRLVLAFLSNLQESLSSIEKQSQTLLEDLLKYEEELLTENNFLKEAEIKYEVNKTTIFYSKNRFLNFTKLLQKSLSESFPSYSKFLESILLKVQNEAQKPYGKFKYEYSLLQKEAAPLYQSLSLFSNKNKLHLLDIKYLFMMLYSMDFLFEKYDSNKNLMIDDKEIQSLSCLIEPFLSSVIESKLENLSDWMPNIDWIRDYFRSDKVIRYIFEYQELPSLGSVKYHLFFDPDDEITLSYKEVYRLIHLIFKSGLNEFKSIYPEDINQEFLNF